MAALTKERDTPHKGKPRVINVGLKANAIVFAGGIVAVDSSGWAVAAGDTATHKVFGRAEQSANNTGGANGAIRIDVAVGTFKYASATIAQADVGTFATIVDDQTVGLAAGTTNDVIAGRIEEFESDGVWINMDAGIAGSAGT